jgi:transposase
MGTLAVFVGLDYHDQSVQVCVLDARGTVLVNRAVENDSEAIGRVVHAHGSQVHAALEACNGSADLADELVQRFGWSVDLAHAGYVARIKQNPDKTDYSDARLLADLERVGYLPKVWLAPEEVRELRRLVRYRQQLAKERRDTKLRVGALLREQRLPQPSLRKWTVGWLKWLQASQELSEQGRWIVDQHLQRLRELSLAIRTVETRLTRLTANDPQVQMLLGLQGVGLITAVTLRAEIGRFDRFRTGKQLSRFCGLSPRNASSGQRQADAGLIKAGNPQLRTVLIETAHRLIRHDPRYREMGLQMRTRGKPGSVTAAAVANRWMRSLHHVMQPYSQAAAGPASCCISSASCRRPGASLPAPGPR